MHSTPLEDQLVGKIMSAMDADDWPTVGRLQPRLDQAEAKRHAQPAATPHQSALWYAAQGIPVFPLSPLMKRPLRGSHGLNEATTDQGQIARWWTHRPDANVGVATGHLCDVIDIDGPAGIKTWAQDKYQFGRILGMVSTPRPGGIHLYITPTGGKNGTKILPGIDHRGMGGYVVAPPSVVRRAADEQIKHDGAYHWIVPWNPTQLTRCRLHGEQHQPEVCWACDQIGAWR